VLAFFGYNESFDGEDGLAKYEAELTAFVKHTLSKAYNGKQAPRLYSCLLSPSKIYPPRGSCLTG
jgi:hypothetical protein